MIHVCYVLYTTIYCAAIYRSSMNAAYILLMLIRIYVYILKSTCSLINANLISYSKYWTVYVTSFMLFSYYITEHFSSFICFIYSSCVLSYTHACHQIIYPFVIVRIRVWVS